MHRIFVIEDHPVLRDAFTNALVHEPDLCVAGCAGSAEEALSALETTDCDLVVTDLMLPGMSGADLVERLRHTRPELPALIVSAYEEDLFQRQAEAAGAAAFLPKRMLARDLVPTVRSVLSSWPEGGPEA